VRSRASRLDIIEQENLCARAHHLGDRFASGQNQWQARWALIGDIAELGQCKRSNWSLKDRARARDEETKQIAQYCYEHGLITITAGSYANIIRVLVPLVITDRQMDEALDVLESAFATVCEKKGRKQPNWCNEKEVQVGTATSAVQSSQARRRWQPCCPVEGHFTCVSLRGPEKCSADQTERRNSSRQQRP